MKDESDGRFVHDLTITLTIPITLCCIIFISSCISLISFFSAISSRGRGGLHRVRSFPVRVRPTARDSAGKVTINIGSSFEERKN